MPTIVVYSRRRSCRRGRDTEPSPSKCPRTKCGRAWTGRSGNVSVSDFFGWSPIAVSRSIGSARPNRTVQVGFLDRISRPRIRPGWLLLCRRIRGSTPTMAAASWAIWWSVVTIVTRCPVDLPRLSTVGGWRLPSAQMSPASQASGGVQPSKRSARPQATRLSYQQSRVQNRARSEGNRRPHRSHSRHLPVLRVEWPLWRDAAFRYHGTPSVSTTQPVGRYVFVTRRVSHQPAPDGDGATPAPSGRVPRAHGSSCRPGQR